jgi:hypothetical protein
VRVWLEIAVALASLALGAVTVFWPDWIELLFHVDPDGGNGAVEWLFVIALLAVGVLGSLLARVEWRRLHAMPREVLLDGRWM